MTTRPDNGSSAPLIFRQPTLVRKVDAKRFLWGDEESGQVSDLIYGRGERLSAVIFMLGPGHWFGASRIWKPLYDQHRFYYVAQGTLAIHDPESGEVAVATFGQAITWRGARFHLGYNVGDDEVVVLDWFAPPERPPDVPERATMASKRSLEDVVGGRYQLLGRWPDRRPDTRRQTLAEGGLTTVGPETALNFVHGTRLPLLVSILTSSDDLTGGTFSLRGSSKSEPEQHPGDEVIFCLEGKLHVHLLEHGDWLELDPLDCAFLPSGTKHEYWSYGAERAFAAFCVAPTYR
jgi:quercetin dioxygenase-like cupin family protein